jgi:hypothetical protein
MQRRVVTKLTDVSEVPTASFIALIKTLNFILAAVRT